MIRQKHLVWIVMNGTRLMLDLFAFIQARTNSVRLPGKVLKNLSNNSDLNILDNIVIRLNKILPKDKIILLLPENDHELIQFAITRGYQYFLGSEENVRERFIQCADKVKAKWILRATGDNPFIDINHIELLIETICETDFDIVSFQGLPIGTGVEIFNYDSLVWVPPKLEDRYKEHVSLHIKEFPGMFRALKLEPFLTEEELKIAKEIRVTIDEEKDFIVCRKIFEILGETFSVQDLIRLYKTKSEIFEINRDIKQRVFSIPKQDSILGQKRVVIYYADPKRDGSGHFERTKILASLLRAKGLEVFHLEIQDNYQLLESDLYIFDIRDMTIPHSLEKKSILLDNFNSVNTIAKRYYSLPYVNSSINYRPILSKLLNLYQKVESDLVLVYSGNLSSEDSKKIDNWIIKNNFSNVLRIGGTEPNSNLIQWKQRVFRGEYFNLLSQAKYFITYFGQSVLEAKYLGTKVYQFSISEYHEKLSKNFQSNENEYLGGIAEIENWKLEKNFEEKKKIQLDTSGYERLLNFIFKEMHTQ
ncbi:MAG: hypothetical protein SFU98_11460 [Leptospiraceae bacterium]|nr:hypothetical protein [Leptospiraceae bacterium]